MAKEKTSTNKQEEENIIKEVANEMLRAYNTLKSEASKDMTTALLSEIKKEVIEMRAEGEKINHKYFAKENRAPPFYRHLTTSSQAVIDEIDTLLREKSKLENL